MIPITTILPVLLSVVMLGACAATAPEEPPTLEERLQQKDYLLGAPVREVQDYRLTGWNYVDDEHLIIHSGPSEYYLLSLSMKCRNLRSAEDVALSTTAGKLTHLDKVIVRSGPSGYTERCPIKAINVLERMPATGAPVG